MKYLRFTAFVALAIGAAAMNAGAQDDQAPQATEARTEEINIELDLNDVVRLEAAVKKVEDELRGQEFIIEAQKLPEQVVQDLDAVIVNLQSQQDRARTRLQREGEQPMGFAIRLPDRQREKGAFLGISGTTVTGALREHLKLPKGVGLLVEHVQTKSAAESAGVKRFDVLHKLDDQLIINAHQLAVLVRTHKAGDDVKLTVMRGGESKELTAKLTEAELEPLDEDNAWGAMPLWREKLERAIEPQNQVRLAQPQAGKRGVLTRVREKDGSEKVVSVDDEHTLILVKGNDGHEMRVLDRGGKEIYRGPLNRDEDLQNLPLDLGKKALPLWGSLQGEGGKRDEAKQAARSRGRKVLEVSEDGMSLRFTVEREADSSMTHLLARDQNGKQIFDGPIDTEEQRKGLPEDLAKRLSSPGWKAMLEDLRGAPSKP